MASDYLLHGLQMVNSRKFLLRKSHTLIGIFFRNKKVVADLAGGEPAFAVDFYVDLV